MITVHKINKAKDIPLVGTGGYTLNGEEIENNNINAAETVTINNIDYKVDPEGNIKVTQGLANGILMNQSLLYTLGLNDSVLNIGDVVKSIRVNGLDYSPNNTGGVDLGNIGGGGSANDGELDILLNGTTIGDFTANLATNESININACTSITQNGLDTSVDANGKVNIGDVVKKVRFLNLWVTPSSDGGVTLPNPSTTLYGALRGGALGYYTVDNLSGTYACIKSSGLFMTNLHPTFLTLDSKNGFVNMIFTLTSLNATSEYNCTYELIVYVESNYACKVWPYLSTENTDPNDLYPVFGALIENVATSLYRGALGYTVKSASISNPHVYAVSDTSSGNSGIPINIDLLPYIQAKPGWCIYKIEGTMVDKATTHVLTRLDGLIDDVLLNGTSVVSNNVANINACTSVVLDGTEYNCYNGKIYLNTPWKGSYMTPYGAYYFGLTVDGGAECDFFGMPFVVGNPNSWCLVSESGCFNLMIIPISVSDTTPANKDYSTDYTIVFDVYCLSNIDLFNVSFLYDGKLKYDGVNYPELYIGFGLLNERHTYAFTNLKNKGTGVLHPFSSRMGYLTYNPNNNNNVATKSFLDIGSLQVQDGVKKRVTLTASYDSNLNYGVAQSLTIA